MVTIDLLIVTLLAIKVIRPYSHRTGYNLIVRSSFYDRTAFAKAAILGLRTRKSNAALWAQVRDRWRADYHLP